MHDDKHDWPAPMKTTKTLDRPTVCAALKALRLSIPEFRDNKTRFLEASGLHAGTLDRTEAGQIVPMIDTIQKWVNACDMTLSEFFATLEQTPVAKQLTIPAQHRRIVGLVLGILNDASTEAQDWIIGCIETFHRQYVRRKR